LEHLADRAIELLETRAQLGALLDALEDEPEDEPPDLRPLAQRVGEEAPRRRLACGESGQGQHRPRRTARDLLENALRHAQEKLLLRAEVPEDGALRDPDLVGEQIERHAVDAARGEEPERRLEDRLLGAHAALLTRARGTRPGTRGGDGGRTRSGTARHN